MNRDILIHHLGELQTRLYNLRLGLAGFENLHVDNTDHAAIDDIEALQAAANKAVRHLDGLTLIVVDQANEAAGRVA